MMGILSIVWENIIVGIFAAGIVGLFTIVQRKIKEKMLEKKYPVAGSYLTEFEDEVAGETVVCTAPAYLTQKGKKIIGTTNMPNDNREWIVEGEISNAGHIHGIYFASDPHDKGIGNFFLFINHDRKMEGLWSGYDSVNKKITSGKYRFAPFLNHYSFVTMKEDNFPTVISISDEVLGKDYLTIDSLRKAIDDENHFAEAAVTDKNEIIGFYLGKIIDSHELQKSLHIPEEEFPNPLKYSNRIGLIQVVAVKSEYHNRGVGTALIEKCLSHFDRNKVTSMCTVGWRSLEGVNIEGIVKNQNFKRYKEFKDYWKEDSIKSGYICHDCGEPPCKCSAIIYLKFL